VSAERWLNPVWRVLSAANGYLTGSDSHEGTHTRPRCAVSCTNVERVTRIELALSAWEADVLPLNYTRVLAAVPTAATTSYRNR
jgi:hypothetical protein